MINLQILLALLTFNVVTADLNSVKPFIKADGTFVAGTWLETGMVTVRSDGFTKVRSCEIFFVLCLLCFF